MRRTSIFSGTRSASPLHFEGKEQAVGPFSADIVCRNTADDKRVVIENQLEPTDHTHLGQLITYCAGLESETMIWVAETIRDDHRAAVDWLNDMTPAGIAFFAVEVELWRIGDSPLAPTFNVVSQPNEWIRNVRSTAATAELTDVRRAQLAFWTAFYDLMVGSSDIPCNKPDAGPYMRHSAGRPGFHFRSAMSTWNSVHGGYAVGELRVDLSIDHANRDIFFDLLLDQSDEIQTELGEDLTWENPETGRPRLYLQRDADILDRDQWDDYRKWLKDRIERIHGVLVSRILLLDVEDWQPKGKTES